MNLEQSVHAAVHALFAADTGAGGLNQSGGSAYLNGGMLRTTDRIVKRNLPRVEVEVRVHEHMDAAEPSGGRVANGLTLLHVYVARDRAFGTGDTPEAAGTLSTIMDRLEAIYDGWQPSLTGWSSGHWTMMPPRLGPESAEAVHRIVTLAFGASES